MDAHRFLHADWRRHVTPGSELAALFSEIERKYRPEQPRVPAGNREGGQWTADGGLGGPSADSADGIGVVAGLVIPICIVGAKSVFGDGTWKVVYICADGREITRTGAGRVPGIIPQR